MDERALSRRGVLGLLGLGGVGVAVARPAPVVSGHDVTLVRTHVAGWRYYQAPQLRDQLVPGQLLPLRREPDNAHDGLAVVVDAAEGLQLGYLPRKVNPLPSRLLELGYPLCAVFAGDEGHDYWDCLSIEVVATLPAPG